MTTATLPQIRLRQSNENAAVFGRVLLRIAPIALACCVVWKATDNEPTPHSGDFNADFSDDFDINRVEHKLRAGFEIDLTAHSLSLQNKRTGMGFPAARW